MSNEAEPRILGLGLGLMYALSQPRWTELLVASPHLPQLKAQHLLPEAEKFLEADSCNDK